MPDFTFAEAAQWFDQAAAEFERDFTIAEESSGDDLLATAHTLSQGPLKPKDLRRMDHPYAKRHGSPRLNPGIINRDSGAFDAGWTMEPPQPVSFLDAGGESGLQTTLYNAAPKADYLAQEQGGDASTMFQRPVDALIEERVAPRREGRIEVALDRLTS